MTTENPFEAVRTAIAFSPYDWAEHHRLAWIYGIAVGWGDALPEVALQHCWDGETVQRLERLRVAYLAAKEAHSLQQVGDLT